jgi:hypothetical protein
MRYINQPEPIDKSIRILQAARCMMFLSIFGAFLWGSAAAEAIENPPPIKLDGQWWRVASRNGLIGMGACASGGEQLVDFGVWQAADGTWQLWSCLRNNKCGRMFHRWEGKNLTDKDWKPMGVTMRADPELGETPGYNNGSQGGLQAPHVIKDSGVYYMFYGDWNNICLARSEDGKNFKRVLNADDRPQIFMGRKNQNTRDPMTIKIGDTYYCYYSNHESVVWCRTSKDLRTWSDRIAVTIDYGDHWGAAECPHVVYRPDLGLYYLFRNHMPYPHQNVLSNTQYASTDPLNFKEDQKISALDLDAPEIIYHDRQYYIAAVNDDDYSIRIAKLDWGDLNSAPEAQNKAFSIPEDSQDGTPVGKVEAGDPDNDALTYTITGGNDGDAFTINSQTGEIRVSKAAQLDFGAKPEYNLAIQVKDDIGSRNVLSLADTAQITITLEKSAVVPAKISPSMSKRSMNSIHGFSAAGRLGGGPGGGDRAERTRREVPAIRLRPAAAPASLATPEAPQRGPVGRTPNKGMTRRADGHG